MYVELISLFSKVLKNQCDSDDLDTLRNRINLISITGLIKYTNRVLGTLQGYICNSKPRRFGKSNKLLGVRHQCGQPNVNLRQVPAQVNE